MPRNSAEKIVLAPRKPLLLLTLLIILVTVVIATKSQKNNLTIGNQTIVIERVTTPAAMAKGLSNRASLGQYKGMLFEFETPNQTCFWMKDMNFPIDIIWLNHEKQIIHIDKNINPETYPNRFCPPQDIMYVLETNAGSASIWGWKKGSQAYF